jgi:hypothetical protein
VEKFYVELPTDLPGFKAEVTVFFPEAPDEFARMPIEAVCHQYIERLASIVQDAHANFSTSAALYLPNDRS